MEDDNDSDRLEAIDELAEEILEEKRYVEEEKPYWLSVRYDRHGDGLVFETWNYYPYAHQKKRLLQEIADQYDLRQF